MWLALAKAIWTQRNKITFNVDQIDEIEIFALGQLHAWSWAKFGGCGLRGTFSAWCMHLIECLREV